MKVPDFSSLPLPQQWEAESGRTAWANYSFLPVYYLCSTRNGKSVELRVSRGFYFGVRGVQWGQRRGFTLDVVRQCLEFIGKHHFGDPPSEQVLLNLLDGERRAFAEECLNRIAGERLLGVTHPVFSLTHGAGTGCVLECEDAGQVDAVTMVPTWPADFELALRFIATRRHPQGPSARSILRKITPRDMQWELRAFFGVLNKRIAR